MNKIHFFSQMGNDEHSLARRRFLIKGALVPLIPMAAILPGAMSMNAVASSGVSTLLILKNGTRFNGLGQDQLLAMQHLGNGYRMYNPTLMRFHAMDNLAPFHEGGVHSYAYVSNDPVNQIDPSGHMGIMAIIGFVGLGLAVVGTALAITANAVSNNQENYAQSIKPEDWTWGYDWSEYDATMQSSNDWRVASKVGTLTAAVGGALLLVGGGAATKSVAKGAKKVGKKVGKSISKTTSKLFNKKPSSASSPSRRNSNIYSSVNSRSSSSTRRSSAMNTPNNTPTNSPGHVSRSPYTIYEVFV